MKRYEEQSIPYPISYREILAARAKLLGYRIVSRCAAGSAAVFAARGLNETFGTGQALDYIGAAMLTIGTVSTFLPAEMHSREVDMLQDKYETQKWIARQPAMRANAIQESETV